MGPPEAPALGRPLDTASRTFPVPATPDLLAHLANPARWTPLDAPVIGAIALQLLCFALRLPRPFFLLSFLIWRLCYNAGLGAILHGQSRDGAFTRLFSALGFSLSPRDLDASTELPEWRKSLVRFFNRELVNHLNEVEDAPPPPPISDLAPEFKSWMAFRFLVDTILLNDFFAYLIMALSYFTWPAWDLMDFGRILAGAMLIWFNVWVKLDAHRVVKDYAWYWGDFFFLPASPSTLTFDGVFELAPHPMYSIGYSGYYGISLITGSYTVLFASLAAHAMQFAFLVLVEDPHIEKVYGGEKRGNPSEREQLRAYFRRDLLLVRNFDPFRSPDLFSLVILAQSIVGSLLVLHYATNPLPWLFLQAIVWRLFWTGGLGYVLHLQSKESWWNKYWIKHGEGVAEGFNHWKNIYNLGMVQTYATFWICAWGCYKFPTPSEWMGGALLTHTLGGLLVLLHAWAAVSVHETLGDFGWFFGDFFLPPKSGLKYSGIYRFLNNPEKVLGHASFYAAPIITLSPSLFALALFSHLLSILFLELVEHPHMRKIYGKEVRHKGGAEKVILKEVKEALDKAPAPVKELVGKVESVGKDMREAINEASARNFLVENLPGLRSLVERSDGDEEGLRRRRRVASNGDTDVSRPSTPSPEATAGNSPVSSPVRSPELLDISKIRRSASGRFAGLADLLPAKLIKEVLPPDIAGAFVPDEQLLPADLESSPYTLTVKPPAYGASFVLGEPIQIEFAAPTRTVTRKDWVGIYRVGENVREKWTNRRSQNRWKWVTDTFEPLNEDGATASGKDETQPSPTTAAAAASAGSASGSPLDKVWYSDELEEEMCGGTLHFEKSRVPWAEGLYEARYHYQGAYSVIVTSAPFEIRVPRFESSENTTEAIATHLLPLACAALELAPGSLTPSTDLADLVPEKLREKQYLRVVYAVKLAFGVEFTWRVAEHTGSVEKLADKIREGREVLRHAGAGAGSNVANAGTDKDD